MISMIRDLFEENGIKYKSIIVPEELQQVIVSNDILDYLSCMGIDLPFYVSSYGTAKTYLYSIKSIINEAFCEENYPCMDHGYLIIGSGPNGDLLCVNCSTGLIGYAFHDDLWDKTYDAFEDIYIELPLSIEQFLNSVIYEKDEYPFDGFEAEKYLKANKTD